VLVGVATAPEREREGGREGERERERERERRKERDTGIESVCVSV